MMIKTTVRPESATQSDSYTMGKRVRQAASTQNGSTQDKKLKTGQDGSQISSTLSKITPFRMIAATILLGVFGYLYISHVFYTQRLHSEVMTLRTQYDQVRIDQLNMQLSYERLTGPSDVYSKAKEMGLVDAGPADKIITPK